ncbi:hypothetical protein K3495_g6121 [Podosphaera aphanis]|nr:hypothetical protein K3495_g6121 [Podosphaera aphanis]
MAEFIGARISLVSNSDIRYVGTLHEINSETSTVALENVSMLGTEGRRPENEVAPLESVYEYILFRGTDVKDLRIEEAPVAKENKPQPIPHDPAILGSRSRPVNPTQNRPQAGSQGLHNLSQATTASYGQHPQYPNFYPPPAIWGRGGPPGLGGFPTMPYGVPPNWHPGSQEYPPGPPFIPYNYPPVPIASSKQPVPITSSKQPAQPAPTTSSKQPAPTASSRQSPNTAPKKTTSDPAYAPSSSSNNKSPENLSDTKLTENSISLRGATEAAAAVTAAMAKLPTAASQNVAAEILATKVSEMGIFDSNKLSNPKQSNRPITGPGRANRGGSSSGSRGPTTKVEVPKEDFDFESANAKFSKHDLVKEAIAGSSAGEKSLEGIKLNQNSPAGYNKSKSFFDNISSEARDREEIRNIKPGGKEWRGEEQRKNLETFGQESVDNSFRGGYRNRGRGRGGFRGRGHHGKRPSARGSESYQSRSETPSHRPVQAST